MASPAIDYDALASQHGGTPASVDYDALAAQHGGKDVTADHAKAGGFLSAVGSLGKGFYENTLKGGVDLLGAAGHAVLHPEDTAAEVANSHPIDAAVKAAKDSYNTHIGMLQQAKQSLMKGDVDDAMERATNAMIPIFGPVEVVTIDS